MGRLSLFSAVLFGSAQACHEVTNCQACLTHHNIFGCEWCAVDWKCHTVGSLQNPCVAPPERYRCYSKKKTSKCEGHTCPDPSTAVLPHHLHLAFAGKGGMRIAWKTVLPTKKCYVKIQSGVVPRMVPSDGYVQYLVSHGYHHAATVKGLAADTKYSYNVICDGVSSATKSFHTETDFPYINIVVMGDMGTKEWGNAAESKVRIDALIGAANFSLHVGDNAYADDTPFFHGNCVDFFCYEAIYDQYMEWMENVIGDKAHMIAVGNHDSECHSPNCLATKSHRKSLQNFSAYNARWRMPSAESGGVASMWYSYDYGPAHFVVLNTETDFPGANEEHHGDSGLLPAGGFAPSGTYLNWLDADLAAANKNRAERPWIIVYGHRPWLRLKGKTLTDKVSAAIRTTHRDIFIKHGVDLFLAGHQHGYHSDVPQKGNPEPATVITGGAGSDEKLEGWAHDEGVANGWKYLDDGVTKQVGTLDITPNTLTWKAHASVSGKVFDSFTLHKGNAERRQEVSEVDV